MNKLKIFIPIILALGVAFGGSVMLYQWIEQQIRPQNTISVAKDITATPVVVSIAELQWGTKITKEMLKTVPFLQESLPTKYYSKPENLVNRVLVTHLDPNEPVTESHLAPEDVKIGGVSVVLATGKRAVSVKGNKVMGLSGFIRPGNRVDILVTMEDPKTKKNKTKLVMNNVPVLATGTQIEHTTDGKPAPVDVYTLEVTPEEAEKLALVATLGNLQFALRNIKDTEKVYTSGTNISDALLSFYRGKKTTKTNRTTRQKIRIKESIEVINGATMVLKKL
ncbi:MAG: Flp pilus assembly protein CpaB [Desulfoplanes sp.]|nr:Flp pilus assembly protein CpaB [Desulfoplanes sp.]